MDRNFTPASPATALASRVLPVPGGPTNSTPLGMRAPRSVNFWGLRRKSTSSCSSAFSSSAPATSAKVTVLRSCPLTTRAWPKRLIPPWPPPWAFCWRMAIIHQMIITSTTDTTAGSTTSAHWGSSVFCWYS